MAKKRKHDKEICLNYPSAMDWMWDYCISLGQYTDSNGGKWDLGIHIDHEHKTVSNASVYGNTSRHYSSGEIYPKIDFDNEITQEVLKRAKALDLLPK